MAARRRVWLAIVTLSVFANAMGASVDAQPEQRCTARARATIAPRIATSEQQRRTGQFVQAVISAQGAGAVLAACAEEGIGYEGRTPARTAQLAYEMQARAVGDGTRAGLPMATDPTIVAILEQYALDVYHGRGATNADKAQGKREFFISCSMANSDSTCRALWPILAGRGEALPRATVRPRPTPRSRRCAIPNSPAKTVFAAKPDWPTDLPAETHHGDVFVVVSLDSTSRIVGTRIMRAADPQLNDSAIAAARASRFVTEIRDCRPIAGDFVFTVTFEAL
jgi:hypothetical protein